MGGDGEQVLGSWSHPPITVPGWCRVFLCQDERTDHCIDYQGLNDITTRNRYSLPLLNSAFVPLHRVQIYATLDLKNAYDLVQSSCSIYNYDILIFSEKEEQHVRHVRLVLRWLLENSLFVKAEKCEFHVPSVTFLGFVLGQGQLSPDSAKVQAVMEWPTPTSRKPLQQFLGFTNFYCHFIRDYSRVAAPVMKLTSTAHPFAWTTEAEAAFSRLKVLFTAPVLSQPDPARQFMVEVNVSDVGEGAVLSQRSAGDQKLHP